MLIRLDRYPSSFNRWLARALARLLCLKTMQFARVKPDTLIRKIIASTYSGNFKSNYTLSCEEAGFHNIGILASNGDLQLAVKAVSWPGSSRVTPTANTPMPAVRRGRWSVDVSIRLPVVGRPDITANFSLFLMQRVLGWWRRA